MFGFLKDKLLNFFATLTGLGSKIRELFTKKDSNQEQEQALFKLLVQAELGVPLARSIVQKVKTQQNDNPNLTPQEIINTIKAELLGILPENSSQTIPQVLVLVGINGAGKTTTIAKIANLLKKQGKKVLLVAGDTFRAAACEQLTSWANQLSIDIVKGLPGCDPAALVYDGCKKFVEQKYDHIIIDTAGRLHTKVNLLHELEKIIRSARKNCPESTLATWLIIDAILGQSGLEQAKIFHQTAKIDGIVLTKCDGSGKGGVVFAINQEIKLPIAMLTFGEEVDKIEQFDARSFIDRILS